MAGAGKALYATIGPDDMLYVPAGWLTAETVPPGATADVIGVRQALLLPHQHTALQEVQKVHEADKKDVSVTKAAVEKLA